MKSHKIPEDIADEVARFVNAVGVMRLHEEVGDLYYVGTFFNSRVIVAVLLDQPPELPNPPIAGRLRPCWNPG
jgi:hypothetical protein